MAAEQAERALRQKAQASELSARALQFWNEGNLAEAEATSRQLLELWRKLLGVDHPQVVTCLETLAAIVRDQGHLDEALRLYDEALKLNRAGEQDLRKLNEALSLGTYDGVGTLLNQQLPQARGRVQLLELLRERGLSAARQGHWREAAGEYARLSELNPADAETAHALASLLVYSGYEAGYERHCSRLLTQLARQPTRCSPRQSSGTAWFCPARQPTWPPSPLAANLPTRLEPLGSGVSLARARGELLPQRKIQRSHCVVAAARQGKPIPERDSQALLFLAMARSRLGQVKEAKVTLANAIQLIGSRLQRIEDGILGENWSEWVRTQVLLREARLMIED